MTELKCLSLTFILSVILLNSVLCDVDGNKKSLDVNSLNSDFLQTAFINGIRSKVGNYSFWDRETDNKVCMEQLCYLLDNVHQRKVFPFFDSWGRLPSGLLFGHIADFGNYDQCVEIRSTLPSGGQAQGKYCKALVPLANVPVKSYDFDKIRTSPMTQNWKDVETRGDENALTINVRIGVCIPASCREELAAEILAEAIGANVRLADCRTNDPPVFRPIDIVAIVIFSLLGFLMLISSVYDVVTEKIQKPQKPLYLAFSVITNSRKLFKIPTTKNPNSIDCLNGIRAITMIWIINGHSYALFPLLPLTNLVKVKSWFESFYSLTIQMAPISVDTFFFLSGMMIAWMGLKEMAKKNGKLNIPLMYFHRVLRLLPPLAATVLFGATLYVYFGDGPLWTMYQLVTVYGCKQNWWRTLLFIQNYSKPDHMCLAYTWYLAIDMQLYILSPLFLFGLYKWGKKVLPIMGILCLLSAGCSIATFFKYDLRSLVWFSKHIRWSKIYVPTHIRYSPWVIGLAFGYLMFEYRNYKFTIKKSIVIVGWLVSIATLLTVVFGPYRTVQSDYEVTPLEGAIYEQFSKIGWSIALCWIIFACHHGYGGQINSILSYPLGTVLVRLSYCMYLTHLIVLSIMYGNVRTDFYFTDFVLMLQFWSAFGITLIVSIFLVLAVESPTIIIEKWLLHKDTKDNSNAILMTLNQEALTEKSEQNCLPA